METLLEKDQKYIWHPFTPQKDRQQPLVIKQAKGTLLYDEEGNAYIDAISSWWVTIHGHAHPYIAEKVYKQALTLEQVIFAGFTHAPAVLLAEKLLPLLPGPFEKLFYSDNGSTSVEVALKMAVQYWWNKQLPQKRTKIFALRNSYHGDTFGAMSVSERSVFTLAFHEMLLEVIFLDTPSAQNMDGILARVRQEGDSVAAFIYEPLVQGAGGIIMYDPSGLDILLEACKEKGILCIADEVMTGFGRTGRLFAGESLQQKADIICLSKGLTGGTMALGATACTLPVYEAFLQDDARKTFFHGHSFTANPIACAAALASLELFEKENTTGAISRIEKAVTDFIPSLQVFEKEGIINNIRHRGTILAFDIISQSATGYLNPAGTVFMQEAMKQGVYLRPLGNTAYIMPPYCITVQELEKVCRVIENTLARMK